MTATCACGMASITVNAKATMHGVCHCTNCKRRTGSAFGVSTYFDKTAITEVRGQTTLYRFHHVAQNHDQERHFCSHCGTTLYWFVSTLPDQIGIAGGCFAEQQTHAPNYSANDQKREPWVTLPSEWRVFTK
jgi:hypothetical protein